MGSIYQQAVRPSFGNRETIAPAWHDLGERPVQTGSDRAPAIALTTMFLNRATWKQQGRRHFVLAATLACLSASSPCFAKVSAAAWLCFDPCDRAMTSRVLTELDRFADRWKALGSAEALFVVTAGSMELESGSFSARRVEDLLGYLSGRGLTAVVNDVRRNEFPSSGLGCAAGQMSVELEALFFDGAYR